MDGGLRKRFGQGVDAGARLALRRADQPVLVDGERWDGRPLGDVGLVITSNRNVVKQHQRMIPACVEAGLRVALLYADFGDGWAPRLEDYEGLGGRLVKLPSTPRMLGQNFPSPMAMLATLSLLEAAIPGKPFSLLATFIDDYGLCSLLCYWARKRGIPSAVVQEGMMVVRSDDDPAGKTIGRPPAPRRAVSWLLRHVPHDLFELRMPYAYADYFCAYGPAARDELIRLGRAPETIFVVGNPSFDHISSMPASKPVHEGEHTIIYVQQDVVEPETELRFYDQLAGICCDDNHDRLIIKLHPQSVWTQEKLAAGLPWNGDRATLLEVRKKGDANEMLDGVDALVTVNSTTAYHAMVRGIPVITVNYLSRGFGVFDAYRYGGAIDVRDAQGLSAAVNDATRNEGVRLQLHEGAMRVIEDHLFRLDGRSSARIAETLAGLARPETGAKAGNPPGTSRAG